MNRPQSNFQLYEQYPEKNRSMQLGVDIEMIMRDARSLYWSIPKTKDGAEPMLPWERRNAEILKVKQIDLSQKTQGFKLWRQRLPISLGASGQPGYPLPP